MENENITLPFPGHKKKWIRVLLKKKQQQKSLVQMKLDLVEDLSSDNLSPSRNNTRKANRRNLPNEEKNFEQLSLNLFNDELES